MLHIDSHIYYIFSLSNSAVVLASAGVGGVGGAAASAGAGAVIGTFILPGFGTAMGAFAFGAVGFFYGAVAGLIAEEYVVYDPLCAHPINKYVLNVDLGTIDDDDSDTLVKEVKKRNQEIVTRGLKATEKTQVSAKILATHSSVYKTDSFVVVKYLVTRNLRDTTYLIQDWLTHYLKFVDEFKRQVKEDIGSFSEAQSRTWRDDKLADIRRDLLTLKACIEIIRANEYIKKLYDRVLSLENDLDKLERDVLQLVNSAECGSIASAFGAGQSGAEGLSKVMGAAAVAGIVPASASVVPVVGYAFAGFKVLTEVYCFMDKHFLQ